ncbi:hypothetical protein ACF08M_28905 [Streptomyces sp. NPDC015032]|uniref:hypothetical protein n=1 Tax=Streptomyces sp. NPDC015032 TaxID=3364937 RepID=UPI0037028EDD
MGFTLGFSSDGEMTTPQDQGLIPDSSTTITRGADGTVTETTTSSDGQTITTTYTDADRS